MIYICVYTNGAFCIEHKNNIGSDIIATIINDNKIYNFYKYNKG